VKSGFKAHRLWTNGSTSSNEYFLLENRQLTGNDEFLPAGGLLVWHIDDSVYTNTDENHPKVKLMQADGLDELKANYGRGDAGDVYPGFSHNQTFDTTSNPSSKSYAGDATHVSATNIPLAAPTMTFNITVRPLAPAQSFDPKTWYRFKNTYQPATHCLDVVNDAGTASTGLIQMAEDGNYSGQHWQLLANADGTYFLRTLFLGPDRRLDIRPGDKSTAVLAAAAPATGQYWRVEPWGDGTWHVENVALGRYVYLDTLEGGSRVGLNAANAGRPTQRWSISRIREIYEEGF
jgi:immune inhibitor A